MRISRAVEALDVAWETRIPLWLHSAPGMGKSSIIQQFREKKKIGYYELRVSQKSPTEIGPVLYINGEKSDFTTPAWVPTEGEGAICIEELADAPLMVQGVMYEFILDRRMGKARLGDGWRIFITGNRIEDKASAGRVSTALNNRVMHITLDNNVDDLKKYAYTHNWHPIIMALLTQRPELIHTLDPKSKEYAFASGRSWEMVSKILLHNPPENIRYELIAGCVGEGPASELEGFLRIQKDLPDLDRVEKYPEDTLLPESPSAKWAVCTALAARTTKKNIENILIYIDRMQDDNKAVFIRDILNKDRSLMETRAYIKWMVKNSDIYID